MEQTVVTTETVPVLRLRVINKEGVVLGTIACRVGLRTYYGPVTRFTDKTVWTRGKSGVEQKFRKFDGNMPCVYKHCARAADVAWNG